MTKIVELEKGVFTAAQLVEADFAELAAQGIRAIVNNRPDGEAADQLPHAAAERLAAVHGIEYRYVPVWNFDITDEDAVDAFGKALAELPQPALFYCRSGHRSTMLWAQASIDRLGLSRVLEITSAAGHERDAVLAILAERLEAEAA